MDAHDELGVDASASDAEVRAAYLRLARALHPDRLVDADAATRAAAEERMRTVNEAFRQVSRRRRGAPSPGGSTPGGPPAPTPAARRPHDWSEDPDELGDLAGYDDHVDLDDTGRRPGGPTRVLLAAAPAVLVAAICAVVLGGLLGFRGVVAVGMLGVAASLAMFGLAPLVVMGGAGRQR